MSETLKTAEPCIMVIFGATGDLTKRKLFPALFNLAKDGHLSENFAIVGVGRQEMLSEDFRDQMVEDLKKFAGENGDEEKAKWFCSRTYYTGGDFDDDKKLFSDIKDMLRDVCTKHKIPENFFFYMAIPPDLFANVAQKVVKNGLGNEENGNWRRFIFEKPFGHDLDSAKKLNAHLLRILKERQIYRIDHYLGKETVQNLLVFRFGNSIWEPIWNRNYVDHIQITVAEKLGVEGRGGYYDTAGALRDMVPNHIFQLVTLTAMEPPVSFEADAVRDEQVKVLQAIKPFSPEVALRDAIRGQYDQGEIGGERVPGYRGEESVDPNSQTETFAALKLSIDNWRWADVPFYIRTGKRMPTRHSSIIIQFKKAPFVLFRETPIERLTTNRIEIHIQPDEGITLHFGAKIPGPLVRMGAVDMDFNYVDHFGEQLSTGYERLLFDCMIGDATLFQRADMVETSWSIVSPVLDIWSAVPPRDFPNYPAGTWGPAISDELLSRDGRAWKNAPE
ncbi:glucose-6-phosphate dehydrogenase [Leptolyngbya sp. 7M]|uniref:glucose-6-phosphate dehydrogenase n=1 Tax=Leptolyngbya sp. 7M TaxID=2812896 RepID=UPI001B8ACD8B|nr:glucose-6-phosphate dehydrogenase [Leptolyngbya sp. 7M]QYO67186.1 glucose-6-phosphate dehydrogenase [Leptolyngbya sp. 7M]